MHLALLGTGEHTNTRIKHPLLKHCDLNTFPFPGAKKLTAPENAKIIASSDTGTPLIYSLQNTEQKIIIVNLNPELDDFFLYTGFISLIYDAAFFLNGATERPPSSHAIGHYYSQERMPRT